ncbi:hypothetical protein PR048_033317 [Dryococelus australis]|uniref:Uncharacterized protein n=1 Tax=Dryococelus australis TaxID=614101 RepID=A0ABQ9FZY1_9NEOP|nr:hypothetical protein PR048_033317 [Dryococelus australis]
MHQGGKGIRCRHCKPHTERTSLFKGGVNPRDEDSSGKISVPVSPSGEGFDATFTQGAIVISHVNLFPQRPSNFHPPRNLFAVRPEVTFWPCLWWNLHVACSPTVPRVSSMKRKMTSARISYRMCCRPLFLRRLVALGAAVAERVAHSPPTKANRVQSPRPSLTGFSHVGIVPSVGRRVFSEISRPPPPALSFRRCSTLTSVILISSQDLDVNTLRSMLV